MQVSRRKLAFTVLLGTLTLAAALVLSWFHLFNVRPNERFAAVFARGSQLYVAVPEGSYALRVTESMVQHIGGDADYLWLDERDDNEVHLYVVQLRDGNARRIGGVRAAEDVGSWAASRCGQFAFHTNLAGSQLYVHNARTGNSELMAERLAAVFMAQGQDAAFFTRRESGAMMLYRVRANGEPERMSGVVEDVRFFYDNLRAMVFYSAAGNLYALGSSGPPVFVAENPEEVLFEHYRPGGNLYMLKDTGQPQLQLYVYDGVSVQRLANAGQLQVIAAVRAHGRPAALLAYENEDEQDPRGWRLAMMTELGPREIPMGEGFAGGAQWQAMFMRTPQVLLTLESNMEGATFGLHGYELLEHGISQRRFLGTQVMGAVIGRFGAYVVRQEIGGTRMAVYVYHRGETMQRLVNDVHAYFLAPSENALLVLHDVQEDTTGTLTACVGAVAHHIANGVQAGSVQAGNRFVGYVNNWDNGAGTLWLSNLGQRPPVRIADGVTAILAVN
ncbi:MAG: hypothetical protein FWE40_01635 [Oscillospiraceae bacterium]|nr:hypothetical protein [Oscillospiraceae bacterium]